jgi:putative drug exporter of the RND superfamily
MRETRLYRYGLFVARRAKLLLVIAALLMIGAGVLGAGAFGKLKNGGFEDPAAESTIALQTIEDHFGGQSNLVLLVRADAGTVDSPAVAAAGNRLTHDLTGEPDVSAVISYWSTGSTNLKSRDGTEAVLLAHIAGDDTSIVERAKRLFDKYTGDRGGVRVIAGGQAGINQDVTGHVTSSLATAEAIAVPLTMLLLILAFGSLVAASLPLAIGGIAILGTFAELSVLGSVTDVSIFSINLTTALGLGLAIDYALFMVSRFREHLSTGDSVPDAVARTVATAGRSVLFTAAAVMAALAALLVFPLYFLRSFGYAGIGVVAIAALAAVVVLPALLALLGHRVNAGRVRFIRTSQVTESRLWGRLARGVMRRPALTALPVIAVLLLAASPLLGVSFGTPDQGVLPTSAHSRQVADALVQRFPGNASSPVDIVTNGPVAPGPLAGYARQLSQLPGVARVQASVGTFVHGQAGPAGAGADALGRPDGQRLTVVSTLPTKSPQALDLVRAIRATPVPDGVATLVTGEDARMIDTRHTIGTRLPLAIGLVALTTFLVLFLFTGSIVQPLRALLSNLLSLSATLGVLTWIFQDGHLSGLLGFTPRPMDMSMTVLLFCIAFGLSMDYEVFVLSRIKELNDEGAAAEQAVPQGMARSGRLVSTLAGLLAVTFFAFGTSSVSFLQLFGIGSGLAILIDATLVRGVLVPAAMRVLGRASWYSPAPLRWVHARVALNEG